MPAVLTSETGTVCTRMLPFAEYPRLDGTELEAVWPHLGPQDAQITVVESEGQIVACWALLRVWHLEGLWIHPEHRQRVVIARRLWLGVRRLAQKLGIARAATAALTDDVRGMLATAGALKLPGDHYVLPLEGR